MSIELDAAPLFELLIGFGRRLQSDQRSACGFRIAWPSGHFIESDEFIQHVRRIGLHRSRNLQVLDRVFLATIFLTLRRDIRAPLILTNSTNKAFESTVKLSALALDQSEIVPDARISLGDLCSALQEA